MATSSRRRHSWARWMVRSPYPVAWAMCWLVARQLRPVFPVGATGHGGGDGDQRFSGDPAVTHPGPHLGGVAQVVGGRDGDVSPVRGSTGPAGHPGIGVWVQFKVDEHARRGHVSTTQTTSLPNCYDVGHRCGPDEAAPGLKGAAAAVRTARKPRRGAGTRIDHEARCRLARRLGMRYRETSRASTVPSGIRVKTQNRAATRFEPQTEPRLWAGLLSAQMGDLHRLLGRY